MNDELQFTSNLASATEIARHLRECDLDFNPPLSSRVNIEDYACKIADHALRYEARLGGELVALVATYFNATNGEAFITSVSVSRNLKRCGIAKSLLDRCFTHIALQGGSVARLEVFSGNKAAIALYERCGFVVVNRAGESIIMKAEIGRKRMDTKRDYNAEIKDTKDHKYAYGFDLDVMHPYMIESFQPFFNDGSLLELGSFKGDFTKRFVEFFDDVTCVEASSEALDVARERLGDDVTFVNARFEYVELPRRYDNIVLTHVLEHLDDPVAVLKRVNEEWLSERGRLFLVCPNGNAASRQIAVKMGLIPRNSAVTPAEAEHGHRCTYTLDTLERDAVAAGLSVVHRSGIFFKALANFQWDRLLQTDIISKAYLDGCYKLGQQYPDLCSSIFLMCERGPQSRLG